jgi:hypothetical protein
MVHVILIVYIFSIDKRKSDNSASLESSNHRTPETADILLCASALVGP